MESRNLQQEAMRQAALEAIKDGKTEARVDPAKTFSDGDKWRCFQCRQDTFGVVMDGKLQVKYREREFIMSAPEGKISVRCRNCQSLNVLNMANLNVTIAQIEPPDATPKALQLAEEQGVDIYKIEGSGKDGKVTAHDVERVVKQRQEDYDAKVVSSHPLPSQDSGQPGMPPAPVSNPPPPPGGGIEDDDEIYVEIDEGS